MERRPDKLGFAGMPRAFCSQLPVPCCSFRRPGGGGKRGESVREILADFRRCENDDVQVDKRKKTTTCNSRKMQKLTDSALRGEFSIRANPVRNRRPAGGGKRVNADVQVYEKAKTGGFFAVPRLILLRVGPRYAGEKKRNDDVQVDGTRQ